MTKPIWEKKNPKKKSTKQTPQQKAAAKEQASKHGRQQPGLVDNINAMKKSGEAKSSGKTKKS